MPGSRTYPKWLKLNHLTKIELNQQVLDSESFKNKPLISIITPVYNPNISSLKKCLDSVINQTYENWELVVVDDFSTNPEVRKVLINYHNKDGRLKVVFNKENLHISESTNIGISESKGIYIGLLDHDDVLYPNALFENVLAINNFKPDFIYSDEDKISEDGKKRLDPFFKPDWSPDFLRSINYITHFAVIKKNLIIEVGGFRKEYDGAQDWDLFLRTTRIAKNIHHIPKVLYGWRMSDTSTAKDVNTKPYVISAQKKRTNG